jgi:hypothetical protein
MTYTASTFHFFIIHSLLTLQVLLLSPYHMHVASRLGRAVPPVPLGILGLQSDRVFWNRPRALSRPHSVQV